MNFLSILKLSGTLIPVLFPKQEFKPKRLAAVIILFMLTVGGIKYIGVENTNAAFETVEEALELTEE